MAAGIAQKSAMPLMTNRKMTLLVRCNAPVLASSRWLEVGASRMLGRGTFLAEVIRSRGLNVRLLGKDALPDEVSEWDKVADVFREW